MKENLNKDVCFISILESFKSFVSIVGNCYLVLHFENNICTYTLEVENEEREKKQVTF